MSAYPEVFVVHLARHRKRRRRLGAELQRHGFSRVTWLKAVDGKKLPANPPWQFGEWSVTPQPHWVDPYARRALTLGEVGCTLSHVSAWQKIAELDYPALVLEDDAAVVAPLIEDLPLLLEDLAYLEFDLCYLAQRNAPGPKPLAGRHVHLVTDYHPVWTLAYLLAPAGARKLLDSPWQAHLIPADEIMPAVFGLNRDAEINRRYAGAGGMVVSGNQRFFTPHEGSTSSETEKSLPVRETEPGLAAFTVATERKPELERLLASGARYGLSIETLGLGRPWRGGEVATGPGGGQKVNLLRPALQALPPEQAVLFVDGYDTLISRHASDILLAWQTLCPELTPLFAAEIYCWPDRSRSADYPAVETPYRFLNSGAFLGKAGDLLRVMETGIADHEDDQRYYTERFLCGQYAITLDTGCRVFQCLNGVLDDMQPDSGRGMLFNRCTESWPAVIHANGPSKSWLQEAGRAVGGRWRDYYGDMEGTGTPADKHSRGG